MKFFFTLSILLTCITLSCTINKVGLQTVYDLPSNVYPLKLLSTGKWQGDLYVYSFEDAAHNIFAKVLRFDPNLKVGVTINSASKGNLH